MLETCSMAIIWWLCLPKLACSSQMPVNYSLQKTEKKGCASQPSSHTHFPLQLVTTFQIFCLDRIQPLSYQSTQQRACWYWVMCTALAADDAQLGPGGRATLCLWVQYKCTSTTLIPTSRIKHCFHPNVSAKSAKESANLWEFPLHIGMWIHCKEWNKITYYDSQKQTLVGYD